MNNIVCHTCLQMFDRCKKSRSDDALSKDHPVYKAKRHQLDVFVSEGSKVGEVMIKGAAPISMPARGTAGAKRTHNVLGMGGHLKRPRGGWGKIKKGAGLSLGLGLGLPDTGTDVGDDDDLNVDDEEVATWDSQEDAPGWEHVMGDPDDDDDDAGLLATTKLPPHVASPHPPSEAPVSHRFKFVLTKSIPGGENTSEDDDQYREADASKDSSVIESTSSTSREGDFSTGSKDTADKEVASTSSDGLGTAKQQQVAAGEAVAAAAMALAAAADEDTRI